MSKFNLFFERLSYSFQIPFYIISFSWLIEMLQFLFPPLYDLDNFGIIPRNAWGLVGIAVAPFLHGSFGHLMGNTFPFIVLFASILYFYPKKAWTVFLIIYLLGNACVWLFARDANHIGASGLVFGFSTFLFATGFFRKDFISISLSLAVLFFYGSMWWGVLPTMPEMSWESHLFGALAGGFASYVAFGRTS